MNQGQHPVNKVSFVTKIGLGLLLPVVAFVAYQAALIESTSGTGSWDGMVVFFGSLVIVPGLLVLDCWVIPIRWVKKATVFLAGSILPATIGVVEYLLVHGPYKVRGAINSAFVAPFTWVWLFGGVLLLPLIISIAYAFARRRNQRLISKNST